MNKVRVAMLCAAVLIVASAFGSDASAQAGTSTPATPTAPAMPPGHGSVDGTKAAVDARKAPPKPVKKVDINNASVAELKTQLVIDEEYAKKIVANRPYKSKGELVTKAGLPEGVYHAIKRKVEMRTPREPAKQPAKPPAK